MTASEEPVDFALLGHPAGFDHLCDLLQQAKPDFDAAKSRRHEPLLRKFFDWTPSYPTHHRVAVTDRRGRTVRGRLIICPFLPDALKTPRDMLAAYQKTVGGCRLAKELGARIVGLGGFTSIVSGDQGRKLAGDIGVAMTSGNSLTAAIALDQIDQVMGRLGWELSTHSLAIVGASGDIGRACTLRLGSRAGRVLLIGRNRAPLERLMTELPGVDVRISTTVADALTCEIILTATSAAEALLDEADFAPGTIAFDVAYPSNVRALEVPRPDTLVMCVGRARLPCPVQLSDYTRLRDPHQLFGCFTEAILLALSGRFESYSVGQGCITDEGMRNILALARDCGVEGADPFGEGAFAKGRIDAFLGSLTT